MQPEENIEYDLFGEPIIERPKKRQKKDWSGDTHSVFVTIGASNHSADERQSEDFYASSPEAGEWLMRLENFQGPIWECCCGQGHLSKVFEAHGYEVKSTDLIDRGYGTGGVNFLNPQITEWNGCIITNPPFVIAQEIIEKALSIVPEGQKVAMFLRVLFLEGKARRELFDKCPPQRVWVTSSRIVCAKNGEFDKMTGGAQAYAWFIFEKGYKGDTILKWFN